jgi:hypothetical protein
MLAQPAGVDAVEGVVEDVGVAVPGLGVHGVDGGEASGVGGRPAALDAVLAGGKIVKARDGVLIHAGEREVRGTGLRVRFAEGCVGPIVVHGAAGCRYKSRAA